MPPIVFVGGAAATYNAAGGSLSIVTPSSIKPGDEMLMVICLHTPGVPFDVDGSGSIASVPGWDATPATIVTAANSVTILRKTVTDSELAAHTATFPPGVQGQAALVAFRGANPLTALDTLAANDSNNVTSHVCPTKVLSAYSSMYLGIVMLGSAAATPPVGATAVLSVYDGTNAIVVFTKRPDVAGATGTQTATTGAGRTGVAASFMIDAPATLGPTGFSLSPVGSIGLPTVGV